MSINKIPTALAGLCALSLAVSTVALLADAPAPSRTVVEVQEVILSTQSQRINLFIDQLLTKKSAKCFRSILMRESHMNPNAVNKQSGAMGMGQLLASTYTNLGLKHSADPLAQMVATLAYLARHFGGENSTCKAWTYWQKHSSY